MIWLSVGGWLPRRPGIYGRNSCHSFIGLSSMLLRKKGELPPISRYISIWMRNVGALGRKLHTMSGSWRKWRLLRPRRRGVGGWSTWMLHCCRYEEETQVYKRYKWKRVGIWEKYVIDYVFYVHLPYLIIFDYIGKYLVS